MSLQPEYCTKDKGHVRRNKINLLICCSATEVAGETIREEKNRRFQVISGERERDWRLANVSSEHITFLSITQNYPSIWDK